MARIPRALASRIQRRREARAPRVVVREQTGVPQVLDPTEDPSAQALIDAAERLILAVQSGSGRS